MFFLNVLIFWPCKNPDAGSGGPGYRILACAKREQQNFCVSQLDPPPIQHASLCPNLDRCISGLIHHNLDRTSKAIVKSVIHGNPNVDLLQTFSITSCFHTSETSNYCQITRNSGEKWILLLWSCSHEWHVRWVPLNVFLFAQSGTMDFRKPTLSCVATINNQWKRSERKGYGEFNVGVLVTKQVGTKKWPFVNNS